MLPVCRCRWSCDERRHRHCQAGEEGETAPAWLNAANEVAVAAFLDGQIKWADIPHLIAQALDNYDSRKAEEEHDIYEADKQARLVTKQLIAGK